MQSWKGGLDWHLGDSMRFRGTYSRDIRAPNLNELFAPLSVTSANFTDQVTNTANTTRVVARGNPDLVPEKAKTLTAGIVLTPSFLPDFNFSADHFRTRMKDAIIPLGYGNVQNLCLASAPALIHLLHAAIRPISNPSDPNYRTAANFPTEIRNSNLNAARVWTHGDDFQLNYSWEMSDLISSVPGRMSFRHLLTYQPVNKTINTPGSPAANAIAPKTRQTTFLTYQNGDWGLSLQNQLLGRVAGQRDGREPELREAEAAAVQRAGCHAEQVVPVGWRRHDRGVPHDQQSPERTCAAVSPGYRGASRPVLSDRAVPRRHGPLLHGGRQGEFLKAARTRPRSP